YLHTFHPPILISAVAEVSLKRHVDNTVYKSQCSPVFLVQRGKSYSRVIQICGPIGIGRAGVHVQRINKMLNGITLDQRVEEKGSRGKIARRRANDANRIDIAAIKA